MINKINFKLVFRLMTLMILVSSCVETYKTIVIETAQPSPDILPANINSLTLMNRSINNEFKNFNEDSLQKYFYSRNFNANVVVLDSAASDTTLRTLGHLLYDSGRYDIVIPQDRNFARELKFYKVPDNLDWNEVKYICNEFNTDALLVIERYYNKLMTKYVIHAATPETRRYVSASIDSKYDAVVKIYDPSTETIISQFVISDTINWADDDLTTRALFSKLPPIKSCLLQTGIQTAIDISDKLSPRWIRESRGFFAFDENDNEKIGNLIKKNDWQSIYDYWLPDTKSSKNTVKSKAEYNMALASEMLGNIDEAIEWANKSIQGQYRIQTENYLRRLQKRKKIMSEFSDIK